MSGSYGLDDFSSDEDDGEEGYSTLGSPLANRRAPAIRPRSGLRVSFVDFSRHSPPTRSATRLNPLQDLSDESDDSDDSSFRASEPLRRRKEREYSVEDAEDSEEEAWPVAPPRPKTHLSRLDVLAGEPWSLVDEAERARTWTAVNLSFSRNLKELRKRQAEAAEATRQQRLAEMEAEEAEIAALLQGLSIQYDAAAEQAARQFEERNKQLWESINATIAATEQLAAQRAAEEEAARKAKEAADRAAEEARAEAKRKALEKLAKEKAELEARAKQAEEERLKAEAAAKALAEAAAGPASDYSRWTEKMKSIKSDVLPAVSQDPALRKACFAAKRQITPKVGQLVNTHDSVSIITERLNEILKAAHGMSAVAYTWALNHLAKSLIKQAETEVTAKQSVAFPLARVVVGLLLRGHVELGDVLMARFVKKCFWVVAWYPQKSEGIDEPLHLKMLGYTVAGESAVQYSERMAGIIALYAALLQTSPIDQPQTVPGITREQVLTAIPPQFQPNAGWVWLVYMMRPPLIALEPVPNLLDTFLAVAGAGLHEVFGRQFLKLIACLYYEGLKAKKAGFSDKSKASQVKLELLLEEWLKQGSIPNAVGRQLELPEAFS